MAGQVQTGHFLFHHHLVARAEFLDVRYRYRLRRRLGLRLEIAEEIVLSGNIVARGLAYAVDDRARDLKQRLALIAHAVECARTDEIFHRAAVQLLAGHALAEILKTCEQPVLVPLGDELLDRAPADALDGNEAEADVLPRDGEVRVGFVHVRRQQLYAQLAALRDILRDLRAAFKHGRQQRRHILLRIVPLHICRAVGDDGVAHRVRLVEGVTREVQYLVIDAVGDALRHAVCDSARNAAARVAVNERDALRIDDLVLLFAHRAADHIGLTEREAR